MYVSRKSYVQFLLSILNYLSSKNAQLVILYAYLLLKTFSILQATFDQQSTICNRKLFHVFFLNHQ